MKNEKNERTTTRLCDPGHLDFYDLRIDNSGRSVNYTIDHNSETILVTRTCDIPNKR